MHRVVEFGLYSPGNAIGPTVVVFGHQFPLVPLAGIVLIVLGTVAIIAWMLAL